jgi:hypothetical protein
VFKVAWRTTSTLKKNAEMSQLVLLTVFSGKLSNDTTITDPAFSIGITMFSFLPFGEEHITKSKSGQILFIPGDCEQFFQVLRALTLFITELCSFDSEFSVKTDNLRLQTPKGKRHLIPKKGKRQHLLETHQGSQHHHKGMM